MDKALHWGECVCVWQGETGAAELDRDTEQMQRERQKASKGPTARETSKPGAQNTEERGTGRERSAGGLVTHGHPGILPGKRETGRREGRRRKNQKTHRMRGERQKGSAWASCSP